MSKPIFFYELCRLCLENAGVCNILASSELLEDVYECTGVKVLPSDNLPNKICSMCSAVVNNAKALRVLAKKNDAHLRCLFDISCCDEICENDKNSSLDEISNLEKVCEQVNGQKDAHTETNTDELKHERKTEMDIHHSEDKMINPVITQTISLRKDLFYSSSQTTSPAKEPKMDEDDYVKVLKSKVKAENHGKQHKSEDDMVVEFVCGICSKEFDTWKKLYLHQRLHNKKFRCPFDICGKKFATKGDLQKHTRTHTGERPYECHICSKGFTQKVSLRGHLATVHPEDKKEEDES